MNDDPTAAGRSSVLMSSWKKLISAVVPTMNKQEQESSVFASNSNVNSSSSEESTTVMNNNVMAPGDDNYLVDMEHGHQEEFTLVPSSVSTFVASSISERILASMNQNMVMESSSSSSQPCSVPSTNSTTTEPFYNTNVFKSSSCNESIGYPLHDRYNNSAQIVEGKKKPSTIMMRRRRSPKRKSNAMMDISDDEEQTSPPTAVTNQPTPSQNMRTRLEPLFRQANNNKPNIRNQQQSQQQQPLSTTLTPLNSQPSPSTSPKSDEDTLMNDPSNYFSDTEMYRKKKDVLEYSKPIPAHFNNNTGSPFQKVFQNSATRKIQTPFPSPTNQVELSSLHNRKINSDIPSAFHNLGLVDKLKEFCAAIPAYSMTSPVVYSPLDLASNLDSLDTVYTCCGNNLLGQLGCGDKMKKTLAFQRRAKGPVKCIAGGNGFVLIATINNELYSCGDNSYGQCAVGPITKKHCPNFMKAVWDKKLEIKQIACGYHHSMILTTCGKVYSCGAGCAGALGLGDFLNRNTFQRVNIIFFGDEVDHIVCGMHYSAIISKSGRLFVTGVNISGELGVGDFINRNLFTYVSEIPLQTNPQIDLISFRPAYSIIYTKYKQALIVGRTLGNRFVYVNGFPNNVKKIIFEGLHTIILCENGILYKCNDDDVEFDSYQMPFFKFKQVPIPSRVVDIYSGIGYAVAVTEDNKFFAIGDKSWIFAVLYGRDKTDENPNLDEFTKLRVDNFHNSVACGGTFTYYYTKSNKPDKNTTLINRIQPLDPYQDIDIKFDTNKRVKTWSLNSVISDYMVNQKKKRKVESSDSDSGSDLDLDDDI